MLLGCIGDDFTGSSDLGNTLVKGGMKTVLYCGIPSEHAADDVEAGVVALKTRSIPAADAIQQSLAALNWLRNQGCRQFLFKYCSTFDSTTQGNIGPVAEALMDALNAPHAVFCPAFPEAGRSVYQAHLFVGDRLLNESGMENHPLTPMPDADLRRWLALQARRGVGHLPLQVIRAGPDSINAAIAAVVAAAHPLVIADAICNADLIALGHAQSEAVLITGGSGIALGLPDNFRRKGLLSGCDMRWTGQIGRAAILSGSCSKATRAQIDRYIADGGVHLEISADAIVDGTMDAQIVADWMNDQTITPLAYSSADPAVVASTQERYGQHVIAHAIETFFAELAKALVSRRFTTIITAGGETSGAVVGGLGVAALEIGPEIDPGVPALRAGSDLVLVLKSGNFGADDFFAKARNMLAGGEAT